MRFGLMLPSFSFARDYATVARVRDFAVRAEAMGFDGLWCAEHLLTAIDDILEYLVERGAKMRLAVGIRWAVMQHEFLAPSRNLAQLFIKTHRLPARQHHRLAVGQIPTHREIGLGQKNGRTIIRWHRGFLK